MVEILCEMNRGGDNKNIPKSITCWQDAVKKN